MGRIRVKIIVCVWDFCIFCVQVESASCFSELTVYLTAEIILYLNRSGENSANISPAYELRDSYGQLSMPQWIQYEFFFLNWIFVFLLWLLKSN